LPAPRRLATILPREPKSARLVANKQADEANLAVEIDCLDRFPAYYLHSILSRAGDFDEVFRQNT
jgi:hypothetical protein